MRCRANSWRSYPKLRSVSNSQSRVFHPVQSKWPASPCHHLLSTHWWVTRERAGKGNPVPAAVSAQSLLRILWEHSHSICCEHAIPIIQPKDRTTSLASLRPLSLTFTHQAPPTFCDMAIQFLTCPIRSMSICCFLFQKCSIHAAISSVQILLHTLELWSYKSASCGYSIL
jgi:hypothetical protein